MSAFAFNPFSADSQCNSDADIRSVVEPLIAAVDFLLPAVQAKRVKLLFDASIESRNIVAGETFRASIARLGRSGVDGPDLLRRWYLYSKNHAQDVSDEAQEVELRCPTNTFTPVSGQLGVLCLAATTRWISFGACQIGMAATYSIVVGNVSYQNKNAHDVASIQALLPIYDPSPKHGAVRYWDQQRQEWVAPMPLDRDTAQRVLLSGIQCGENYFGRHEASNTLYRFVRTRGNIYHGFQVGEEEIPANCLSLL